MIKHCNHEPVISPCVKCEDKNKIESLENRLSQMKVLADLLEDECAAKDKEVERLREALSPFALFASVFDGRDDIMTTIVGSGDQSLGVGAFQTAREALKEETR